MSFFKKKKTTGDGSMSKPTQEVSNNPYLAAKREWLERYGDYIHQASMWRLVAIACLIITAISVFGNVLQASQYKVVPYVVEVDKLGNSRAVARADRMANIPQRIVQAELANFVQDWRTVTADIDLQQKMIDRISFFVAEGGKGFLKEWYSQNNPYDKAKRGLLISVEIKGLPLSISAESYRVEWTEITRSHSGIELDRVTYEARLSVLISPPTQEAVIVKNPGGIYVTSIATSKVLGVTTSTIVPAPEHTENQ